MESPAPGKPQKPPKVAKVKNKAPAEVQITAEQLLREAKERELEIVARPPKQKINDPEELAEYRMKKRKAFEDNIRKNRGLISNWLKYATWEESQKEIKRARSVYERAVDVDHRNIPLWLRYAEMEMRNKQINHARNLWDRAVTILPRANQFWYKYTYMEEMLQNVPGCRAVFERWMEWEPEEQAWQTYIKFELRYKELDRARHIYERFTMIHPHIKNWIKFAKFEERYNYVASARAIYERAIEFFGEENMFEELFIGFARFEENQKEHDRVRVIYKYALDHIPKEQCQELYKQYTIHEKKYGDRKGIEDVIVSKRKFQYETELEANPSNYDAWFDLLRLVESEGDPETIRETYERAIANVPPTREKRFWRRYIYLWVNYAVYEELEAADVERARQVYRAALELLPHKHFTFAKLWLMYAHFEIRQRDLTAARRALGTAIGRSPKDKLFRGYIELEIQLREFDRCRMLYEKFLEFGPQNCTTWIKFAELETLLGDSERARAIYELAINQPRLDMPEILWKSYIDFETEQEEFERTRQLYERLLQRTQHVKVWMSFAQFELRAAADGSQAAARAVYQRSCAALRQSDDKEERLMLMEAWRSFEEELGSEETLQQVLKMMPKRVKKRRKIVTDDGEETGWEEFFDYIFPEDEAARPNLKLLQMAKLWRKQQDNDDDVTEDAGAAKDVGDAAEDVGDAAEAGVGEREAGTPPGSPPRRGAGPRQSQTVPEDIDRDDSAESSSSSDSDS